MKLKKLLKVTRCTKPLSKVVKPVGTGRGENAPQPDLTPLGCVKNSRCTEFSDHHPYWVDLSYAGASESPVLLLPHKLTGSLD